MSGPGVKFHTAASREGTANPPRLSKLIAWQTSVYQRGGGFIAQPPTGTNPENLNSNNTGCDNNIVSGGGGKVFESNPPTL